MKSQRILSFDIESTNLKANFGYCLAFGYKYLGKPAKVLTIADYKQHKDDPTNDSYLMRDAHRILTDEADIIISYYGKQFDRQFLNTRMLLAGLPPLPPLSSQHIDLYWTAKKNLALHSNRLDVVSKTLGSPVEKTSLSGPIWIKAMAGDPASIKYIAHHCKRDCEVLEWCYLKLRGFIRQHPLVSDIHACKNCGGTHHQFRGYTMSNKGVRSHRRQCKGCGLWSTAPLAV